MSIADDRSSPLDLRRGTWRIRPFDPADVASLVRHGNDPAISAMLRDRFPSPYTEEDARTWVAHAIAARPMTHFAIEVDGEAVGGIGFDLRGDIHRVTAEIGYWLGTACQGRGIATWAVREATEWVRALDLERVEAEVFETNAPSIRVLEKAGYVFEGRLGRAAIKRGAIVDLLVFGRLREPRAIGGEGLLPREDFAALVARTPLVSIDLLVWNERDELLVGMRRNRPARGCWFVPGGRVRKGERFDVALRRLAREELGIDVDPARAVPVGVFEHLYDDNFAGIEGVSTHYVVIARALRLAADEPRPPEGDQHDGYRWLDRRVLREEPRVHPHTRAYADLPAPR